MLRLFLLPSNLVCDAMKIEDEHERSMMRMLVNTVLWMTIGCTILTIAWAAA